MTSKSKTSAFFCRECGFESSKWLGQCPACKAWNSMVEEPIVKKASGAATKIKRAAAPAFLDDIKLDKQDRAVTGMNELDRVLGGGIVAGSLILVGGDPGIGKSTILLQVGRNLALSGKKVIYISGEESLKQIKMRANRIGKLEGDLRFLCETSLDAIRETLFAEKPDIVVIDSIQTMFCETVSAAPGSVSQVRESTNQLMQLAKGQQIAIFLVGHVTKEGQVAGPRVLEHMVDTVLYFEGEKNASYRILRAVKNRFGSTNEVGVFEMQENGLKEVANPSAYMLSGRPHDASGAVVSCSLEGTRPILLEVQALVTRTVFGLPRRMATGADYNRVNMLMAVLEKRLGIPLSGYDAYINIAGGIRMNEPAVDLAIVAAIISSYKDIPVGEEIILFGEVGLSGEVRGVTMTDQRIREAAKLGFTKAILPHSSLNKSIRDEKIECAGVYSISDMIKELFKK